MMILLVLFLVVLCSVLFLLGIGFKLTGALLAAVFWSVVQIPIGIAIMAMGLAFCCTIILLPVGIGCMKAGFRLIIPGI